MGSEKKRKRKEGDTEERKQRKHKKEKDKATTAEDGGAVDVELNKFLSPIAKPLAGRKLTKKLFKLIGAAAKEKGLKRGIREVILSIRKGGRGVVVLAGDVFPIDVIAHIPIVCEEVNIPYCYVNHKSELGSAGLTNRPTSVVLVSDNKASDELKSNLSEMKTEVEAIQNLY